MIVKCSECGETVHHVLAEKQKPCENFEGGKHFWESQFTIAVTGGRNLSDQKLVADTLSKVYDETPFTILVHGGAKGADHLSARWALDSRCEVSAIMFRAEWKAHGRGAGPKRNETMLAVTEPFLLVAFKGGTGTADCVRRAREKNIRVLEVPGPLTVEKIHELLRQSLPGARELHKTLEDVFTMSPQNASLRLR